MNDDTPSTTTVADLDDYGGDVAPHDEVDDDDDDDDDALTICLAIKYGGRTNILRAATELALSIISESSSATFIAIPLFLLQCQRGYNFEAVMRLLVTE